MASRTVVSSAARTASGNSGALVFGIGDNRTALNLKDPTVLALLVDITAVGGDADETMDISIEWSHDGSTFAVADGTADTFNQMTQPEGAQTVAARFNVKAPQYRIVWTMAGTTPSFTFSVDEYVA